MKLSYKWLTEYIDVDLSIEELGQKITDAGIEVEEIIPLVKKYNNIILGNIESIEKHPDADKLTICKVFDGTDTKQVICGAANVKIGQHIAYAQIGATLPNGLKIKKAKIRGVESFGMICSKAELGLEDESAGIWPIVTDFNVGSDINDVLKPYNDYIFDLFITSNRPDCFSHIGIAREVAAFTGKELKLPQVIVKETKSLKVENKIEVIIEYPEGCKRYAARYITNVKIAPSPKWLVGKLSSIGSRSINNIVDVTNFVLHELGQPLHAFDYDKIAGHKIIIRKSKEGDKFTTLDEKERHLPLDSVMICDAEREVAIGGIMGGLNSEVSESTTNILLESAYFNPENIVQSTRKLGLVTDASIRFEKGVDHENVIFALNRAAQLIQEIAGGEIAQGIVDEYPNKINPITIPFRPSRANRILGTSLNENDIKQALSKLNLIETKNGYLIPSYRVDLREEIDLVEEIARMINLDRIPASFTEPLLLNQAPDVNEVLFSHLRKTLIETGLSEIFTNSMIGYKRARITREDQLLKILNPISDDLSVLRPSLLQGILTTINHNKNRNNHDLSFFEIGRIFRASDNNVLPDQPLSCAFALTGERNPNYWDGHLTNVDFYDIKGIIEELFEQFQISAYSFQPILDCNYLDTDHSLKVYIEEKEIGYFGKVSPDTLRSFDIKSDVFFSELNFELLKNHILLNKKYNSIGKYPYIEKDLALLLPNKIQADEVIKFIQEQGGKLLKKVEIFDVYLDKKLNTDQKSIAFHLKFQSDDRTLKDEEVVRVFIKIIKKCEDKFNAKLRDS